MKTMQCLRNPLETVFTVFGASLWHSSAPLHCRRHKGLHDPAV